jgi:hypothetical protein
LFGAVYKKNTNGYEEEKLKEFFQNTTEEIKNLPEKKTYKIF